MILEDELVADGCHGPAPAGRVDVRGGDAIVGRDFADGGKRTHGLGARSVENCDPDAVRFGGRDEEPGIAQLPRRRAQLWVEDVRVSSIDDEPIAPGDDAVERVAGGEHGELVHLGAADVHVHDGQPAVASEEDERRLPRGGGAWGVMLHDTTAGDRDQGDSEQQQSQAVPRMHADQRTRP